MSICCRTWQGPHDPACGSSSAMNSWRQSFSRPYTKASNSAASTHPWRRPRDCRPYHGPCWPAPPATGQRLTGLDHRPSSVASQRCPTSRDVRRAWPACCIRFVADDKRDSCTIEIPSVSVKNVSKIIANRESSAYTAKAARGNRQFHLLGRNV